MVDVDGSYMYKKYKSLIKAENMLSHHLPLYHHCQLGELLTKIATHTVGLYIPIIYTVVI